jgi:hypothetical protein
LGRWIAASFRPLCWWWAIRESMATGCYIVLAFLPIACFLTDITHTMVILVTFSP